MQHFIHHLAPQGMAAEKSCVAESRQPDLDDNLKKASGGALLYIDDVKAVRWWHRIAVQADWYLDGWKKKNVFPDFLVALEETKGKPSKLVVVETKGLHLKNEDTDYKRKLFETLERMRVALWGWF